MFVYLLSFISGKKRIFMLFYTVVTHEDIPSYHQLPSENTPYANGSWFQFIRKYICYLITDFSVRDLGSWSTQPWLQLCRRTLILSHHFLWYLLKLINWSCKGSKADLDVNFPLLMRKYFTGIGYFSYFKICLKKIDDWKCFHVLHNRLAKA